MLSHATYTISHFPIVRLMHIGHKTIYTPPNHPPTSYTSTHTHTHEKCLRSSMCDSCNTCSIPLAVSSTIPSNPPKPGVVSELKLLHTINGGIWLCSSWDACVLVAMPETTFQSCLWASLSLAA